MITGMFFILLIAGFGMIVRHTAETEGGKILAALAGRSRPVATSPARVVTVSWQSAPARRLPMLAAAA